MSPAKYRAYLKRHSLIRDSQHVCHIIAKANGGADHFDNYFAAGAEFNMRSGCSNDAANVYLNGLEKGSKAVLASQKYGTYTGLSAIELHEQGKLEAEAEQTARRRAAPKRTRA